MEPGHEDIGAVSVVLTTIVVSALCYAYVLMHAGIVIAE
jgi:hypothetical protein